MDDKARREFVEHVLNEVRADATNEEIIHLILDKKIAEADDRERPRFGDVAADKLAGFAGSWGFVLGFSALLLVWILVNLQFGGRAFDPYPFILLNLVLSCVAAVQAPLIMMSQNRQERKDRARAENDYRVNLKCEIILEDLHYKLDRILQNQAMEREADE